MLLNHLEMLRVRADDGLATAADRTELAKSGVDAAVCEAEWSVVRTLVLESLDGGRAPELAAPVLGALDLSDALDLSEELGSLVAESLRDEGTPDIAAAVLESLGFADGLAGLVAESLYGGEPPELADDVLGSLELADDLGSLIAGALSDNADGEAPELAEAVLTSIGRASSLSALVAESLDGGDPPELADSVLESLGMDVGLSASVRESLDAGAVPDLWSGIAAQLDGDVDAGDLLREAMASDVGEIDIADAVMAELGLQIEAEVPPAEVVPLFGRRVAVLGTILAAAAALMLYIVPGTPIEAPMEPAADSFVQVIQTNNEVEIEELESSPDAMVQIFQTEAGAPTIIFIDEMDDFGADTLDGVPL